MQRDFNIVPMSKSSYIFIIVICLAVLAIVIVPIFLDEFSWKGTLISLFVFIVITGIMGMFGYQGSRAVFSLTDKGLRIRPGLYGRTIPRQELVTGEARVINLDYERNYQARWRLNGAGLPGYASGWFSLNNGEKALMFVTDKSRVVYIPTNRNYSVLLSAQNADEMVKEIREWD